MKIPGAVRNTGQGQALENRARVENVLAYHSFDEVTQAQCTDNSGTILMQIGAIMPGFFRSVNAFISSAFAAAWPPATCGLGVHLWR